MQANEETPPALAPLFHAANVLEQELPKQDELTPQTKQAAAENILANANDAKLHQYAQYLGRGGKIYVHVLGSGLSSYEEDGKVKKEILLTKKHYEDAVKICNERFIRLDVNLKVVLIMENNQYAEPLTREEFQTRKADKTKRQTMPTGFDEAYNPMDTYVLIDDRERGEASDKRRGLKPFLNEMPAYPLSADGKWGGQIDNELDSVLGKSSLNQFLAMINISELSNAGREFGFQDTDINQKIAKTIALAIEHEVGHSKFALHSSNSIGVNTDRYYETSLRKNSDLDKGDKQKNSRNTTKGLKEYFNASGNKHFVSREDASPVYNQQGHVLETIMDEKIKSYYIENMEHQVANNLQEGYDTYMITILQLLHGTQKGEAFNIDEYNSTLENLRKERDILLTVLLSTNMKEYDAIIAYFDSLERKIEAYVDVLRMLDMRTDFQDFINAKPKTHPIRGQNTFETAPQD